MTPTVRTARHRTVPCRIQCEKTLKRQLVYCLLTCSKMLSFSLPHLFNALFIIPLASKAVTRGGTDHSNNNKIFPPLPLNFGYDLELYCVKMHHHARLLGQWSFLVRKLLYENTHTHTHTRDRSLYPHNTSVGNNQIKNEECMKNGSSPFLSKLGYSLSP